MFSGALKSSTGLTAKPSLVEDGVLVQITSSTMVELKAAIKDMKDYVVNCGKVDDKVEETVEFNWIECDDQFNVGYGFSIVLGASKLIVVC